VEYYKNSFQITNRGGITATSGHAILIEYDRAVSPFIEHQVKSQFSYLEGENWTYKKDCTINLFDKLVFGEFFVNFTLTTDSLAIFLYFINIAYLCNLFVNNLTTVF